MSGASGFPPRGCGRLGRTWRGSPIGCSGRPGSPPENGLSSGNLFDNYSTPVDHKNLARMVDMVDSMAGDSVLAVADLEVGTAEVEEDPMVIVVESDEMASGPKGAGAGARVAVDDVGCSRE